MAIKVLSKKKSFLLTKKILIKYLIYLQNYTQNQIQNIGLKKKFQDKNIKNIVSFMKKDKKNNNKKINLVLLKKIGKPIFNLNFENKKLYSFLKKELND